MLYGFLIIIKVNKLNLYPNLKNLIFFSMWGEKNINKKLRFISLIKFYTVLKYQFQYQKILCHKIDILYTKLLC